MGEKQHDHTLEVVRRKLGDATLKIVRWEAVGDDGLVIDAGTPTRTFTKGKRMGCDDWRGVKTRRTVVTSAEIKAERADYENRTGNCAECCGTAQTWTGWNHETGNRFEPCRKCKASGKAVGQGGQVAVSNNDGAR